MFIKCTVQLGGGDTLQSCHIQGAQRATAEATLEEGKCRKASAWIMTMSLLVRAADALMQQI